MARSKQSQYTIVVNKRVNLGSIPLFVQFGHKCLEKSHPAPKNSFGTSQTFIISKDILRISVSDPTLLDDIESVEFTYAK